ncbi:MAG: uracil-DNA glycosylase [Sediminicola sp.]|jgi:uracil-DNA glycosylase
MHVNISSDWKSVLAKEFEKDYFIELTNFINSEYKINLCYPPKDLIFSAFNKTPFEAVKVVIIGQDPYHGNGQANGLCFSVSEGVKHPPSLVNVFREIKTDLQIDVYESGNLERWASQGVLLLNATLTVRGNEAASHQQKGWEKFTDAVISNISERKEGVVFMLWGGFAKKKGIKVDREKHFVLESGHPSPLSANRGYWFGNKHFSTANTYLKSHRREPISWL